MFLDVGELIEKKLAALKKKRSKITYQPGLALVWVGEEKQTAIFVRAKQRLAKELNCKFSLHRFNDSVSTKQLKATIHSLNFNKSVNGIVLQLPLPKRLNSGLIISQIRPEKDVDGLLPNSKYPSPTAEGIIDLLNYIGVNPAKQKTLIIGAGRLVGKPLVAAFKKKNWPFTLIESKAQEQAPLIHDHEVVISATGVSNLIKPVMVHREMIVIDGSGVDVNVDEIEPLVKAVTPRRGAVGPLTVINLFHNLLTSAKSS